MLSACLLRPSRRAASQHRHPSRIDRPALIAVLTTHMLDEVTAIALALPKDRIALQWDVCQEVTALGGLLRAGAGRFPEGNNR
jgi:hypothetical protein